MNQPSHLDDSSAFELRPEDSNFGRKSPRTAGRSDSSGEIPVEVEQRLRAQLETFRHDLSAAPTRRMDIGRAPRFSSQKTTLPLGKVAYAIGVLLILVLAAVLFAYAIG